MRGGLKAIPLPWDRGDGYDRCPENGDEERRTMVANVQAGLLLDQQLRAIVADLEAWGLGDIQFVAVVVGGVMRMARWCVGIVRGLKSFGGNDVGMISMRFQHACIGNA